MQQGAGAAETCVFKERQKNIKEEKKEKQTQPNPAMGGGMPQKLGGGSRSGFPRSGWGAGLVAVPRDPAAALIGGAAERWCHLHLKAKLEGNRILFPLLSWCLQEL